MMAQKILIIQAQIPPYRVPFFEELGKRYDITVLYFTGNPGAVSFKTIRYQGPFYRFKFIRYTPGVRRIVKEYDCVIIMFDLWWLNLVALPFTLKGKHTRSILWGHGIGRTHGIEMATVLRRYIAAKAHALIFYTKETKEIFRIRTGVQEKKCFVANNTILVKNTLGSPLSLQNRNYFLYLGRVQQRKQIPILLQAYALLSSEYKHKYQLYIVGDGDQPFILTLKELAASLGLSDKVVFEKGTYDEHHICQYYSKAVAYVSPGAVGLGVAQSFAYGVPVITTTNAGHGPEFAYCNDENSYFYADSGDTADRAQQLNGVLVKAISDNTLWQRKAAAAQYTYEKECNMENMLNGFAAAIAYAGR
jgi:glycosyltransferase involved in cell wall biosynthesis